MGALAIVVACQVSEEQGAAATLLHPLIGGVEDVRSLDVTTSAEQTHALLSGPAGADGKVSVVYTTSLDRGATWHPPVRLSRDDDPPVIAGHGNDVQLAAEGRHLVAVWQVQGNLPGTGPMVVSFSRDGGVTWLRGGNPATGDLSNNQSYMELTSDHAGHFHLVWLDDRNENGNAQGLRYARSSDQGETWQMEATLDESACTCCWNRIAAVPGQGVVVLYRDQDPHDMRLSRSENAGRSWQSMPAVGDFDWRFAGCPHCGGALTVSASSEQPTLHSLVWTGKPEVSGLYYLRSLNQGQTWSTPYPIGTDRSRRADIAAADQELAAVFADATAKASSISLIRSADGGRTWSEPKVLTNSAAADGQPRILRTVDGFQAFWTERDPAGRDVFATALLN
jgi:hypothetical protein